MQCIIRAPVDGGSLSQWLVINKIIGERWQRFLEFFLICTSSRAEFFATPFSICEGWLSDDPLSRGSEGATCTSTGLTSGTRASAACPGAFACPNVPQGFFFLSCILSRKKRFKDFSELLRTSAGVDSLRVFLQ